MYITSHSHPTVNLSLTIVWTASKEKKRLGKSIGKNLKITGLQTFPIPPTICCHPVPPPASCHPVTPPWGQDHRWKVRNPSVNNPSLRNVHRHCSKRPCRFFDTKTARSMVSKSFQFPCVFCLACICSLTHRKISKHFLWWLSIMAFRYFARILRVCVWGYHLLLSCQSSEGMLPASTAYGGLGANLSRKKPLKHPLFSNETPKIS